jgi:hypothetical protein
VAHGPIEFRERLLHPGPTVAEWHRFGRPGLKEPRQCEQERLIGLARVGLVKIPIPLVVAPTRHELSG